MTTPAPSTRPSAEALATVRRLLTALVLVAGVITPAISMSGADAGTRVRQPVTGIGIRLVDIPVATKDDPRARTYILDRLAPGSVIQRRVEVINGTRSTASVSMYPAAASIRNGEFVGAAGHTPNELSMWTSTRPRSVVLAPRHKSYVRVTVHVPADASPGERYGVVWAEVTTPPAAANGITQVSRVGIRLYLSIGPGGAPASDFVIVSMTAGRDEGDDPMVNALVRNTGGRALDLSGTLSLSHGPGGLSAGPFPVTLGTTLGIGKTEPVSVLLDRQVPDGPWLTTLTVQSGLTKRTAHATLTFPAGPGLGHPVRAETTPGSRRWTIAAVVAVAGMLLLLAAYVIRRRRDREDAGGDAGNRHRPRPDIATHVNT